MSAMIGEIRKALTPFYDQHAGRVSVKSRPVLVIAQADTDDYVVLPVSTVSHRQNIDPVYDIEINPVDYPHSNLTRVSYVRTHKQTIVHRGSIADKICDLKSEYQDLYLKIVEKREQFSTEITNQAL